MTINRTYFFKLSISAITFLLGYLLQIFNKYRMLVLRFKISCFSLPGFQINCHNLLELILCLLRLILCLLKLSNF